MPKKKTSTRFFMILILFFSSIVFVPNVAHAENCGWAMVNADGVSGAVLVGDCGGSFLAEWNALGLTEGVFINYGCKLPCRFVIQTRQSESGNVAGYSSSFNQPADQSRVTYDGTNNSFTVSNGPAESPRVSLIIRDGIATDSTGRSFNTGTGISTTTTLSADQFNNLVKETNRIDSANTQQSSALAKSKELALQTPGIERCVTWEGYLENGRECSLANISDSPTVTSFSPYNSLKSESSTVIAITDTPTAISESITVTVKKLNEFTNSLIEIDGVKFRGKSLDVINLASKLEGEKVISSDISKNFQKLNQLRPITYSATVKLPDSKYLQESLVSNTPSICSTAGILVTRLSKGTCDVSYSLSSKSGNEYSTNKMWVFK